MVLSLFSPFVTNLTASSLAPPSCLYRMRMYTGKLKIIERTVWRQQRPKVKESIIGMFYFRVPVPVRCVVYRLWSPKVKESIIGMFYRNRYPKVKHPYNAFFYLRGPQPIYHTSYRNRYPKEHNINRYKLYIRILQKNGKCFFFITGE
jgi:hypothetical protein